VSDYRAINQEPRLTPRRPSRCLGLLSIPPFTTKFVSSASGPGAPRLFASFAPQVSQLIAPHWCA
jgi:hypothetical protein